MGAIRSIPNKVKEIIDEYIKMIELNLPNFLEAYYTYGCVSLGVFDYGRSDIDFVTVMKRKPTETDISILKKFHSDMHKKYRKTILNGMYLMNSDVQSLKKRVRFHD